MNTNHYPDIERCKKLTEIGFPYSKPLNFEAYANPTVMEMLDVIPEIEGFWFEIYRHKNDKGEYCVSYEGFEGKETACLGNKFFTGTLPNALADLIFWLHENNYIKF